MIIILIMIISIGTFFLTKFLLFINYHFKTNYYINIYADDIYSALLHIIRQTTFTTEIVLREIKASFFFFLS